MKMGCGRKGYNNREMTVRDSGNRSVILTSITAVILLLTACSAISRETATPAPLSASPGMPFILRVGQEALISGEGLRLRFDEVVEDSRCPLGALCVWAGQGVITLTIEGPDGAAGTLQLSTLPPNDATTFLKQYDIRLQALTPYPASDEGISAGEYRATLLITR